MNIKPGAGGISPEEKAKRNAAMPNSGQYLARCYQVVSIGTVEEEFNKQKSMVPKINISFEIYGHPFYTFDEKKGPQPFSAGITMRFSNSEKSNLTKFLKAWYNSDPEVVKQIENAQFQMQNILGRIAQIGITKNPKKSDPTSFRLDIESIVKPMPGYENQIPPQSVNPLLIFDVDSFNVSNPEDVKRFMNLPGFIRDMVLSSYEFKSKMITMDAMKSMHPWIFQSESSQTGNAAAPPQQGWGQQPPMQQAPMQQGYPVTTQQAYHAPMQQQPMQQPPMQQPPMQQMPAAEPVKVMTALAGNFSYSDYIDAGWKDADLIAKGYMVIQNPPNNMQGFGSPGRGDAF